MAVIGFFDEGGWVVARWVFARFVADMKAGGCGENDLVAQLEQAVALDGLHLDLLEPDIARRLFVQIHSTAKRLLLTPKSKVDGREGDTARMYQRAILDLLSYVERNANRFERDTPGPLPR